MHLQVFVILVLSCYVNFGLSAVVELKEISDDLRVYQKPLRSIVQVAENAIANIEGYQSGSVINVPGELENLPGTMEKLFPLLQIIEQMITKLANIAIKVTNVKKGQGVYLTIPNQMLYPYTKFLPAAIHGLNQTLTVIETVLSAYKSGVLPMLSAYSFNSAGSLPVPQNTVKKILGAIDSGLDILTKIASEALLAAKQSTAAELKNLSVKASAGMNILNKVITQMCNSLIPAIQRAKNEINALPISYLGNGFDQINFKKILNLLNGALEQFYTTLGGINGEFEKILNALNVVDNGFGGFLFNVF